MKSTLLWMVVGATLLFGESVNAWGGLFNRFKPEALKNEGYGSHSGIGYYPFYQVSLKKKKKFSFQYCQCFVGL